MMESRAANQNLYLDSVDAAVSLLNKNNYELGLAKIYSYDELAPEMPSAAVTFIETEEDFRAQSGARNTNLGQARISIYINLEVWYYHEQFSPSTNDREVVRKLWEMTQLFRQNPTIDGYAMTLGSKIIGSRKMGRVREIGGGSVILAGGLITLQIGQPVTIQNRS